MEQTTKIETIKPKTWTPVGNIFVLRATQNVAVIIDSNIHLFSFCALIQKSISKKFNFSGGVDSVDLEMSQGETT